MEVTKMREINISSSTGITVVYQYGVSGTGTEISFPKPFYDKNPNFKITNIAISSGGMLPNGTYLWDYSTGVTSAKITFNPNSDIVISAMQ